MAQVTCSFADVPEKDFPSRMGECVCDDVGFVELRQGRSVAGALSESCPMRPAPIPGAEAESRGHGCRNPHAYRT